MKNERSKIKEQNVSEKSLEELGLEKVLRDFNDFTKNVKSGELVFFAAPAVEKLSHANNEVKGGFESLLLKIMDWHFDRYSWMLYEYNDQRRAGYGMIPGVDSCFSGIRYYLAAPNFIKFLNIARLYKV